MSENNFNRITLIGVSPAEFVDWIRVQVVSMCNKSIDDLKPIQNSIVNGIVDVPKLSIALMPISGKSTHQIIQKAIRYAPHLSSIVQSIKQVKNLPEKSSSHKSTNTSNLFGSPNKDAPRILPMFPNSSLGVSSTKETIPEPSFVYHSSDEFSCEEESSDVPVSSESNDENTMKPKHKHRHHKNHSHRKKSHKKSFHNKKKTIENGFESNSSSSSDESPNDQPMRIIRIRELLAKPKDERVSIISANPSLYFESDNDDESIEIPVSRKYKHV